jgi:hypothetical protein
MFAAIRRAVFGCASGHSGTPENGLRHFASGLSYDVNLENRQCAVFGLTNTNLLVSEQYSKGLEKAWSVVYCVTNAAARMLPYCLAC